MNNVEWMSLKTVCLQRMMSKQVFGVLGGNDDVLVKDMGLFIKRVQHLSMGCSSVICLAMLLTIYFLPSHLPLQHARPALVT